VFLRWWHEGGEFAEAEPRRRVLFWFRRGEIGADMHEDDSPYDEVRASVSNIDDPDMPGELNLSSYIRWSTFLD